MPWTDEHLNWLRKTDELVKTADGKLIAIWEFRHSGDAKVLAAWAKHFRNHYCLDTEIDQLRKGTSLSRQEYLTTIKFPDISKAPGPSVRAGDFTEILVADYLQYVLGYWVPRMRYGRKMVRNESSKGCDTLAFKFVKDGAVSPNDVLALFESKADLTGKEPSVRLQDAVNDSIKDQIRKAESLNAIKQYFFDRNKDVEVERVERFQSVEDNPYKEQYGAVALISHDAYCAKTLGTTTAASHPNRKLLDLVVIRGKDLMPLVHELYRRAADEA
jgi:hypothetical protein